MKNQRIPAASDGRLRFGREASLFALGGETGEE